MLLLILQMRSATLRRGAIVSVVLLIAVALPCAPGPLAAEAPSATLPHGAAHRPETRWYGWQTLLADAGVAGVWSLALAVDAARYDSISRSRIDVATNTLVVLGFAGYAMGAPAIHLSHGRTSSALRSVGLRVGLPFAGALLGMMMGGSTCSSGSDVPCSTVGGAIGAGVGGLAAAITDAVWLAHEPVGSGGPSLQTAFVPALGGGTLTVAGRF